MGRCRPGRRHVQPAAAPALAIQDAPQSGPMQNVYDLAAQAYIEKDPDHVKQEAVDLYIEDNKAEVEASAVVHYIEDNEQDVKDLAVKKSALRIILQMYFDCVSVLRLMRGAWTFGRLDLWTFGRLDLWTFGPLDL